MGNLMIKPTDTTKLITDEHIYEKHTNHSVNSCSIKHCHIINNCHCGQSTSICSACMRESKISYLDPFICKCGKKYDYIELFSSHYKAYNENYIKQNHKCEDNLNKLLVGGIYGKVFEKCKIHNENRCYRCGQWGGQFNCSECTRYYFQKAHQMRKCKRCTHNHRVGVVCEYTVTNNISTSYGLNYNFNTTSENKCNCCN